MAHIDPILFVCLAVFLGGFVSGMSGFAFSAVAGAIILHYYPPTDAIPLMLACSLASQMIATLTLRAHMQWQNSLPLISGGLLGMPLGLHILSTTDPRTFRIGFGIFLVLYSAYMLLRRATEGTKDSGGWVTGAAVGFASGIVGGLTAFPGALATIWCDLLGLSKDARRGTTQPFIAAMQLYGISLVLLRGGLSPQMTENLAFGLPALAVGTLLGVASFGKINDLLFRRIVLSTLLVSGLALL